MPFKKEKISLLNLKTGQQKGKIHKLEKWAFYIWLITWTRKM